MKRALPLLFAAAVSFGAIAFVLVRGEEEESIFDRVPSERGNPLVRAVSIWRGQVEVCLDDFPDQTCIARYAELTEHYFAPCIDGVGRELCGDELLWIADELGWNLPVSERTRRLTRLSGGETDRLLDEFNCMAVESVRSDCLVDHAYVMRRVFEVCEEFFSRAPCAQMLADMMAAARVGPYAEGDLQSA